MLALALVLVPHAGTPLACPLVPQSQELDGVNVVEKAQHYRSVLGYGRSNSGELAAFIAYAQSFPTNLLCLVDTYDTLNSGVPNFLCVALALSDIGHKPVGIRLDSGDLAYLSKKAREMFCQVANRFDKPFFADLMIVASNDINEPVLYALAKQVREEDGWSSACNHNLVSRQADRPRTRRSTQLLNGLHGCLQGHAIDAFGVGTHLVTCQAQPALGCVYKLVEINSHPRIKLSQEITKVTMPCRKNVYRLYAANGGELQ